MNKCNEEEEEDDEQELEWKDMSMLDRAMFVLDLPFMYLRKLTLPPGDEKKYSKM